MLRQVLASSLLSIIAAIGIGAQDTGATFDRVVDVLAKRYYDRSFREESLSAIAERWREHAHAAESFEAERHVINSLLSEIPASHLALISEAAFNNMLRTLLNQPVITFGLELIEIDGEHYAHTVLAGAPAAKAGVMVGDRVIAIDGMPPAESARIDWSTDDAFLPDPPIRDVLVGDDLVMQVTFERRPGEVHEIEIEAAEFTAIEASRESARVIQTAHHRIGYMRFWFVHIQGPAELLAEKINTEFAECDALILDLRGRGGSAAMVPGIIRVLEEAKAERELKIVAIVDSLTRSAKEAIAFEIKERKIGVLVGERTAGALLPAAFARVGNDAVLMYPAFALPKYTERIEGVGVEPDIKIDALRRYNDGRDPLIDGAVDKLVEQIKATVVNSPAL